MSIYDDELTYERYDERPLIQLRHVLAEHHVLSQHKAAATGRKSTTLATHLKQRHLNIQQLEREAGVEGMNHLPPTQYELDAAHHRLTEEGAITSE